MSPDTSRMKDVSILKRNSYKLKRLNNIQCYNVQTVLMALTGRSKVRAYILTFPTFWQLKTR